MWTAQRVTRFAARQALLSSFAWTCIWRWGIALAGREAPLPHGSQGLRLDWGPGFSLLRFPGSRSRLVAEVLPGPMEARLQLEADVGVAGQSKWVCLLARRQAWLGWVR